MSTTNPPPRNPLSSGELMSFEERFPIVAHHAPVPSRRRPGRRMNPGVRFVVAHDTANPGADAMAHARWYRRDPNPASSPSSAHIFVDDVAIVETVPALTAAAEQALHVRESPLHDDRLYGFQANAAAVGVEYCYGSGIDAAAAYARYTWVLAKLCHVHGLDPARAIVGHMILDPARRHDPSSALTLSGHSYAGLLVDVVNVYRDCVGADDEMVGSAAIRAGTVRTTVNLRVRAAPSSQSAVVRTLGPDTSLEVLEIVDGETVSHNNDWCRLADGFCWSGGVVQV